MTTIRVGELHQNTSEVLRRVRENGESFTITYYGSAVARLVPVTAPDVETSMLDDFWAEWDALANEIGENWPEGTSAVDAVREGRRDFTDNSEE